MGKLFDGFQARVADEDDNEVPDGTPGELLLRADDPFAMATGYFGMADKTVEAWRNLWLHTGDRVVRNDEGFYKFIDRMKDSIRRRGENISSFEVEQVIMAHPAVEIAAVFPVPSDLAEDEVMTTVVVKEGATLDGADADRLLRGPAVVFRDPALRRFRRRAAAHRKRQGAEIQVARTGPIGADLGSRGGGDQAEAVIVRRHAALVAGIHVSYAH